jgi:protein-S-isoprenylcysteine O-methyltransferase Ste14
MNPKVAGSILVALQFSLLAALMAIAARGDPLQAAAVVLFLLGTALGLSALWFNRPGNFNIHPEPKSGGVLVRDGPYRWIRHPMYSAVLLFGAGCAWASGTFFGWGLWIALAATLNAKAALEEGWLSCAHPAYADYRSRTKRFVPGLF